MKCDVLFSQGSVRTIFRWGGYFSYMSKKIYSSLQQCKNYENRSRFSKVIITNVLPPFLWFTVYITKSHKQNWTHSTNMIIEYVTGTVSYKLLDGQTDRQRFHSWLRQPCIDACTTRQLSKITGNEGYTCSNVTLKLNLQQVAQLSQRDRAARRGRREGLALANI